MDYEGKIVVVTGGAQGIGRCIAEEFKKAGATACVIDKQQGNHFVGDLADKAGFITGENICIDGGMTHQMIYHGDNGWTLGV